MADVVNLGRARKRKQRAAEQQRADENAIRHGRTKAEKARERMEQARLHAAIDGARREPVGHADDASAGVARMPEPGGAALEERPPAATRDDDP